MDRNQVYPKEDSMDNPNERNDDDEEDEVVLAEEYEEQIHYQDELVYYLHQT